MVDIKEDDNYLEEDAYVEPRNEADDLLEWEKTTTEVPLIVPMDKLLEVIKDTEISLQERQLYVSIYNVALLYENEGLTPLIRWYSRKRAYTISSHERVNKQYH